MSRRNPDTYLPGALDMFWLISESPRGEFILDDWHGRATALELARVLWPMDPLQAVDYPHLRSHTMNGLTPAQWVAKVLDYEARPCFAGGAGRIRKDGDDYIVSVLQARTLNTDAVSLRASNGRPYLLPKWQKN